MLTVKQVAERLRISPSLVYGLCAAGKIRHERYGLGRGCIRVAEEALDDYRRVRVRPATPSSETSTNDHVAGD